jgi:hypothetical protein
MSLIHYALEACKIRAKKIYTNYIQDKSELTDENIENAINQYAKDTGDSTRGIFRQKTKGCILHQSFQLADWFIQGRKCMHERDEARKKTAENTKIAHKRYLINTDKIIEGVKDEIIEDKIFLSKLRLYNLTLTLQTEKRKYQRLLEKENKQDFAFTTEEEIDPKELQDCKETGSMKHLKRYEEQNNMTIPENWILRIKTETLRFLKTIN